MTLQKQILERIQKERVRPTPRGYFKARDYVMWFLLGVSVAALSVGFGMIIFMVKGADLALFEKLGLTASEKVAYSIPFFWILSSLALAGIAFINFRNTRHGYRTSGRQFALISALIALTLGSIAYALNLTEFVDRVASKSIPVYNAVVPLNTNLWLDPERGLLSGHVRNKESDKDFMLRDSSGELWRVTGRGIAMPEGFSFSSGDRIKIIGTKTSDAEFKAIEIRPWEDPKADEEEAEAI
ncbi:MAG: hypothetical protein HZA81_01005 [Candidatus Taylorbacteria bacterium]|nr:hypothetical protein [Candidatus Taylorbacteria bacterium]